MTSQRYLGEADEDHEERRGHAGVLLVIHLLIFLFREDEPSHPPHSLLEHGHVPLAHSGTSRRLFRILVLLKLNINFFNNYFLAIVHHLIIFF